MSKTITIAVAQMEVLPGNPLANVRKMLTFIEEAKQQSADLIVFPELCIPGYLIGDLWEQEAFIRECMLSERHIEEMSDGIAIIFGNVYADWNAINEDGRVRKYNTLRFVENRQWGPYVVKTLQPNYREFDDNRHFFDNKKRLMGCMWSFLTTYGCSEEFDPRIFFAEQYKPFVTSKGISIGGMLCEDGWDDDYESPKPFSVLAQKSDLIVNISCSPYTNGKNSKRNRIFSRHAREAGIPMLYVNNTGIQNNGKTIYTFDGSSCMYDKLGNMEIFIEPFKEGLVVREIDLAESFGAVSPSEEKYPDDIGMLYRSIHYGLERFLKSIGVNKVVIGLSGGIDSALVTAIISRIVSAENLWLVNMPSKHYSSATTRRLAESLAKKIGCKYSIMPIDKSVFLTIEQLYNEGIIPSTSVLENVQARDRFSRILAACAASFGGIFTCNGNKSELTVGYTTLYGDLGGAVAPIGDLWKTQVYAMARWFNSNIANVIPDEIFGIKPSAELSAEQAVEEGKGDPLIYEYHDKLFCSWVERWNRATPEDILDWLDKGVLESELGYNPSRGTIISQLFQGDMCAFVRDLERWWNLYQGMAVAKRIQAPPILAVSRRAFGFDHREAQIPPYYTSRYHALKKKLLT